MLRSNLKTASNTPAHMVKKSKLWSDKSCIRIFNYHAYCLTIENAYLTTSVNDHFYSRHLCVNLRNPCIIFMFLYNISTRRCNFLSGIINEQKNWIHLQCLLRDAIGWCYNKNCHLLAQFNSVHQNHTWTDAIHYNGCSKSFYLCLYSVTFSLLVV